MKQRTFSFLAFFVLLILSMTMTNFLTAQNCGSISFANNAPEDPAIIPYSPSNIGDDCLSIAFPMQLIITDNMANSFDITALEIKGTLVTTGQATASINAALTESLLPFPFDGSVINPYESNVTVTIDENSFHIRLTDIAPNMVNVVNSFVNSTPPDPYLRIFVEAQDGVTFPGDIYIDYEIKAVTLDNNGSSISCAANPTEMQTVAVSKLPPTTTCTNIAVSMTELVELVESAETQIIEFTANQDFTGYMDYYVEVVDEYSNLDISAVEGELPISKIAVNVIGNSTFYEIYCERKGKFFSGIPLFAIQVKPNSTLEKEVRTARFENMASRVKINRSGSCCSPRPPSGVNELQYNNVFAK